ncbi:MAG: hypothetical protein RLY71_3842 [Pseudomonadota bacterium]|jgi:hypothetical protein
MQVFGRKLRIQPALQLLLASVAALALHACGGGGVGTNGTGIIPGGSSAGTVTGFGSVIVDGVRYDDSQVVAQRDDASGSVAAELQLGQRLELSYNDDGQGNLAAQAVRVAPSLVGPVQSVVTAGLTLTVLNQLVQINTNAAAGPVTVFGGGYASLADIVVTDWVEVHAVAQPAATAGAPQWRATRIEKVDAQTSVRIAGRVSALQSGTGLRSFQIGGLTVQTTGGTRWPGGTELADGQAVVVFGPSALPGYSPITARLIASQVTVQTRSSVGSNEDRLAGWISGLAADKLSFEADGVSITLPQNPTIVGGTLADLVNGAYVLVRGHYTTDDDHLLASSVELRYASGRSEEAAELHGTVLDWTAATRRFTLRGVVVDASQLLSGNSKLSFGDCAGFTDLANGMQVEIKGIGTSYGVQATRITCKSSDSSSVSGEVVELRGTLAAPQAASFTLHTDSGDVVVSWSSASTYLGKPMTAATLGDPLSIYAGQVLEVEGRFSGTGSARILKATKIKLKSSGSD